MSGQAPFPSKRGLYSNQFGQFLAGGFQQWRSTQLCETSGQVRIFKGNFNHRWLFLHYMPNFVFVHASSMYTVVHHFFFF